MEREVRIRLQIEQPAPLSRIWLSADVDTAFDVVEHDLEPPGLTAPPSGGRDVDRVPAFQRGVDRFFGCSHTRLVSAGRGLYSLAELGQRSALPARRGKVFGRQPGLEGRPANRPITVRDRVPGCIAGPPLDHAMLPQHAPGHKDETTGGPHR